MSPEQTRAVEVKAVADNAMLKGLTKIEEAAKGAGEPFIKGLKELDETGVEKETAVALEMVEKNQTGAFEQMLGVERARQDRAMADMESSAEYAAEISSKHLRETAEQWAENQAKNYIYLHTNGSMAETMRTAEQTAVVRQEATELAKGTIQSAAQSLKVAKEAQLSIDRVPKNAMVKARAHAAELKVKQVELNHQIALYERNARRIADVAMEGHAIVEEVLKEAEVAEKRAKNALETARGNSKKIAKLKERAEELVNKALAVGKKL